MKLLNKSLIYLSISLFFIIGIWSIVFYFNMLNEIKESVDEGIENYKRQIVYEVQKDTSLLSKKTFHESFYSIVEIQQEKAIKIKDLYIDTMVYMQDADDEQPELEPVRMLTTAFENNGHYYELCIISSMVEEDDLAKELFRDTLFLYLILIACIILINNFVLQRLWKPFYSLIHQLRNYRMGSSPTIPQIKTQTKEFNYLQQALTSLLQHTHQTYEQQKQFIGNASHELQTPLAIAINKLELLIEKGNLTDDQAENIADIMQIIERLARINKSLLLLTKIENKQFLDNQLISINTVIKQSLTDLEETIEFKKIEVTMTETGELTTSIDSSLASVIISNLLRNAIFHNHQQGSVDIAITENSVKINNTGLSVAINQEKLFSRFYKSENPSNSTGLGLAIVKAICDLYGFSISYHFENSIHSFELRFR